MKYLMYSYILFILFMVTACSGPYRTGALSKDADGNVYERQYWAMDVACTGSCVADAAVIRKALEE